MVAYPRVAVAINWESLVGIQAPTIKTLKISVDMLYHLNRLRVRISIYCDYLPGNICLRSMVQSDMDHKLLEREEDKRLMRQVTP